MVHQNLASGNRKYKSPGIVAHHLMHNYLSWLYGYIHSLLQMCPAPSWTDIYSSHLLLASAKPILFCAIPVLCRKIVCLNSTLCFLQPFPCQYQSLWPLALNDTLSESKFGNNILFSLQGPLFFWKTSLLSLLLSKPLYIVSLYA